MREVAASSDPTDRTGQEKRQFIGSGTKDPSGFRLRSREKMIQRDQAAPGLKPVGRLALGMGID
jgi:hypothetical protein